MDVCVRNVGANDFHEGAFSCYFFHVFCNFFNGSPEGEIVFFGEIVNFVTFEFRNDKGVALGLWMNVEKSEGFLIFVNFVTRDFSRDDF